MIVYIIFCVIIALMAITFRNNSGWSRLVVLLSYLILIVGSPIVYIETLGNPRKEEQIFLKRHSYKGAELLWFHYVYEEKLYLVLDIKDKDPLYVVLPYKKGMETTVEEIQRVSGKQPILVDVQPGGIWLTKYKIIPANPPPKPSPSSGAIEPIPSDDKVIIRPSSEYQNHSAGSYPY